MAQICNFERLDAISMGDQEFADELVRVFLDDAGDQIERLRLAVESADAHSVAQIAHRLKGAAGNVGAETMAEACRMLERAAYDPASPALSPHYGEVRRQLERTRSGFASRVYAR